MPDYPRTFKEIIKVVLIKEGGYVNDPTDRGGETNFGISKRAFPNVDIKNLTEEQAIDIYYIHYWVKGRCNQVPESLKKIYFDMCVNFGIRGAVRVLQETANSVGANIRVDGLLGPNTSKSIKNLKEERVRAFRMLRFAKIVISKPEQVKFWYGWYRRCNEV